MPPLLVSAPRPPQHQTNSLAITTIAARPELPDDQQHQRAEKDVDAGCHHPPINLIKATRMRLYFRYDPYFRGGEVDDCCLQWNFWLMQTYVQPWICNIEWLTMESMWMYFEDNESSWSQMEIKGFKVNKSLIVIMLNI